MQSSKSYSLLCAILGAAFLGGILCQWIAAPYWLGFTIALLAFMMLMRPREPTRVHLGEFMLSTVIPLAVLVFLLGYLNKFGLTSLGTADAGLHARFFNQFAAYKSGVYNGFVGFYSVVFWVRSLGFETYDAFAISIYGGFVLLVWLFSQTPRYLEISMSGLLPAAMSGSLLLLLGIFLLVPLYGEFMLYGAFVHVFCSTIIILWALLYSKSEAHWTRVGLLVAFCIIMRFSYGLNLGDMLLASGLLCLREGVQVRYLHRRSARGMIIGALGVGLIIGAMICFLRLLPILGQGGGATAISLEFVHFGFFLGLVGYALGARIFDYSSRMQRLLELGALFVASALIVQIVLREMGVPIGYYTFKYTLYPALISILLSSALVMLALSKWLLREGVKEAIPSAFFGVASLLTLTLAYAPYRDDVYRKTPITLVDRDQWKLMQTELEARNKKFGGYISGNWPRFSFVNGLLHRKNDIFAFSDGRFRAEPGYCIFWESSEDSWNWLVKNSAQFKGKVTHKLTTLVENTFHTNPSAISRIQLPSGEFSFLCL